MRKLLIPFFLILQLGFLLGQSEANGPHILFVTSNADYYGDSDIPTSNHFSELVFPYDVFIKAGYTIDFISPEGGPVPIGYINTSDILIRDYIYDCGFMNKLQNTYAPNEIDASKYDAIYFGGGGASMFGVHNNTSILNIAQQIYEEQGGILSAVCHGSISLSNIKSSDGTFVVKDKAVNGFPDLFENNQAEYFKQFEYSVESLLKKREAQFKFSEEGWDGYWVKDGRIITGQDPTSAKKSS